MTWLVQIPAIHIFGVRVPLRVGIEVRVSVRPGRLAIKR
jgi:hypothetical protein